MYPFITQPKKFFKKIAFLALFVLVFQFLTPFASVIPARADDISDAQQEQVQMAWDVLAIKEQLRAQADALRVQITGSSSNSSENTEPTSPPPDPAPSSDPAPVEDTSSPVPLGPPLSDSSSGSVSSETDSSSDPANTSGTTSSDQNELAATNTTPASVAPGTGGENTTAGSSEGSGGFPNIFTGTLPPSATTEVNVNTGGSVGTSTSPSIDITNQGDDGVNLANVVADSSQSIETDNETNATNTQEILADSGHNTLTCMGSCEGSLTTGPATSDSTAKHDINKSNVVATNGGGGGGINFWPGWRYGTGADSGIENGGDGAVNIGDTTILKEFALIQKNDAILDNTYTVTANTGGNNALTNYKFKDFDFTTKEARSRLTLMNMVNTNLFNSEWWPLYIGLDEDTDGDINLMDSLVKMFGSSSKFNLFNDSVNQTITNTSGGDDAFNKLLTNLQEKLTITSEQSGIINNTLKVNAVTGQNNAISAYKIKDFNYESGDANATLTLLNFLNTQLVSSHWATGVINVNAKWAGDLILPSITELLWGNDGERAASGTPQITIGDSGEDSFSKALVVDQTERDIQVMNNANVESRVRTNSISGDDTIAFFDDLEDSSYASGDAKNLASQFMLGNTFKFGGGFFNLIVNNLGTWGGQIEGAPENAKIEQSDKGVVVTAESASGGNLAGMGLGTGGAPGSSIEIQNAGDDVISAVEIIKNKTVIVQSHHTGKIVNDIEVNAISGESTFAGLDGKRLNLKTGDTKTITTIGNVFNTTLVGTKVMNVIVNVMGDWNGKISFKKSLDLQAVITASRESAQSGDTINYTIEYANLHDKDTAKNTVLTAHYDAQKTELIGAGGATETTPGTLTWTLGEVGPNTTATKSFSVKVKQNLDIGEHQLMASAEISSLKPESVTSNNTDGVAVTVPAAGSSGGAGSGSGTGTTGGNGTGNTDGAGNTGTGTGNGNTGGTGDNNTGDSGTGAGSGTGSGNGNTGGGAGAENTGGSGTVTGALGGNTESGGGGSNGGGSSSSGTGSATLRVEKSAQVSGSTVPQGATVHYVIVLRNTGDTSAKDVKVYDRLKIDGVQTPDDFSWDIGEVMSREEIRVEYDVIIEPTAQLGKYVNTAYASGFDIRNKVVVSNDSSATITVVKGTGTASSGNGGTGGTGPVTNSSVTSSNGTGGTAQNGTGNSTTTALLSSVGANTEDEGVTGDKTNANPSGGASVVLSDKEVRTHIAVSRSGGVPNRMIDPSAVFGKQVKITRTIPMADAGQAFAAINAPLTTNINADAYVLALADMDRQVEQHTRGGGGVGIIVWLWLILLFLLLVIGYLAYREHRRQKKISN